MRIGKIKKIIKRPDVIPVKLPQPKKTADPIPAPNWPTKQPQRKESEYVPRIHHP